MQRFNRNTAFLYYARFDREHRALTVAWGILSILFCVLVIVAFVQPQWIGDTPESPGYGHVGLFAHCYPDDLSGTYSCNGDLSNFNAILNDSFKAATVLTGVAALLMMLTVVSLLLFFCFKKGNIYFICGVMEAIAGKYCILS